MENQPSYYWHRRNSRVAPIFPIISRPSIFKYSTHIDTSNYNHRWCNRQCTVIFKRPYAASNIYWLYSWNRRNVSWNDFVLTTPVSSEIAADFLYFQQPMGIIVQFHAWRIRRHIFGHCNHFGNECVRYFCATHATSLHNFFHQINH